MFERCGHCGREGTLEHLRDLVLRSRDVEIADPAGGPVDAADQDVLQIRLCRLCDEPTFARYQFLDSPWSDPEDARDFRQIFPQPRSLEALPPTVAARFAAMLEVSHLPDAFAVRAGKVLEAVCGDQQLPVDHENDLSSRLDQLASKRHARIPSGLRDQAHLVRRYRNVGGHHNDFDVEAEDVLLIREFVEVLLDYLYLGPAKLQGGLASLHSRQGRHS